MGIPLKILTLKKIRTILCEYSRNIFEVFWRYFCTQIVQKRGDGLRPPPPLGTVWVENTPKILNKYYFDYFQSSQKNTPEIQQNTIFTMFGGSPKYSRTSPGETPNQPKPARNQPRRWLNHTAAVHLDIVPNGLNLAMFTKV